MRRTLLFLATLGTWTCGDGAAPTPRVPATFPGIFLLEAVDNLTLPTDVNVGFAVPMIVTAGQRTFESPPGFLKFSAIGAANGTPVLLSTILEAYAVADSFYTADGVRGRVTGDVAEFLSPPSIHGEHRWRFRRPMP